MITEDYVSFENSKILKEKGFGEECLGTYNTGDKELNISSECSYSNDLNDDMFIAAPTLQMAMKWLREVHNIFIQVDYIWSTKELYTYTFDIHNMKSARSIFSTPYGELFNSYEEACEAAIKYCLTNLI